MRSLSICDDVPFGLVNQSFVLILCLSESYTLTIELNAAIGAKLKNLTF